MYNTIVDKTKDGLNPDAIKLELRKLVKSFHLTKDEENILNYEFNAFSILVRGFKQDGKKRRKSKRKCKIFKLFKHYLLEKK
jgi:hypothetical protein